MTVEEFLQTELSGTEKFVRVDQVKELFKRFLDLLSVEPEIKPETIWELQIRKIMHVGYLRKRSRRRDEAKARQIVMWYLQKYENYTQYEAAALFGRDHATALHSRNEIENMIETRDPIYYDKILAFLNKFKKTI